MSVHESAQSAWMALALSVSADDGVRRDVMVHCPSSATVGVLTAMLADKADLGVLPSANQTLASERVGLLARDKRLQEVDLMNGDVIRITRDDHTRMGVSPHSGDVAGFELHVVGGPAAGAVLPLSVGEMVIGRDPTADLPVDDPSLSRRHFAVRVSDSTFELRDLESTNGTSLEGERVSSSGFIRVEAGQTIAAGRTMITVRHRRKGQGASSELGMIKFNRPPRVAQPYRPPTLEVPQEPGEGSYSPLQIGMMVVPLVLGGVMAYVMKQPIYLLFTLLSPLMLGMNWFSERRRNKKGAKSAIAKYKSDLADFESALDSARAEEITRRKAASPDPTDLTARARERTPDLWERRPRDSDYLLLNVGNSRLPSQIEFKVAYDQPTPPVELTEKDVPVTVDLPASGTVGLHGDRERVQACARWMLAQAATLHGPAELSIVAMVNDPERWDWLKWLPHCDGTAVGLPQLSVVSTRSQISQSMRALHAIVSNRAEAAKNRIRAMGNDPRQFDGRWLLLVVDENAPFDHTEMSRLLDSIGSEGTCCIWIGSGETALPGECGATVGLRDAPAVLTLTDVETGAVITDVNPTGIGLDVAESLARDLAPVRVIDKARSGSGIPASITFSELNGIERIDASSVAACWNNGAPGLTGRIGATAHEPFDIDIEVDGPHGLVAGTTGAGKSELLQSYVMSTALRHTPERVSFLFIDYKGGAAFKECIKLPHAAGMVTDLDDHLAKRVLVSLQAELRGREHLLRDHGAKDMTELRKIDPAAARPSLLIVVDEFAALASEVPEFVDGLVDVAQRGRSLGVHLILATQKPGGVVSGNIRANTNLRIALRVADEMESMDVLDSPESGRIPRTAPGRAFARMGHGDLTEFQTAYLGSPVAGATLADAEIVIQPFEILKPPRSEALSGMGDDSGPTELSAFVDAMQAAARNEGIENAASPWLPPLDPVIDLNSLPVASDEGVAIGMADEPRRQLQRPLAIDLSEMGSLLIYGASGTGKTTMLRTIAAALSLSAPPDRLSVFGLDCAGRALMDIQDLPNVGSVVPADDQERTRRLLAMIRETIDRRAVLFAQTGATDIESYAALSPDSDEPRIVLLLDSYAGFTDRYERVDLGAFVDLLPRLMAEGPPVGVHIVATGDRRAAFPMAVSSVVSNKFVMQMATEDEEISLGLPREWVKGAKRPAGRGLLNGVIEFQCAVLGTDPSRDSQAGAIRRLADQLREQYGDSSASEVQSLPTHIDLEDLSPAVSPWRATLGIDDSTMQQTEANLDRAHFLVSGPYRSGRSSALRVLATGLAASTAGMRTVVLAPRKSPLTDLDLPGLEVFSGSPAVAERVETLKSELAERTETSDPLLIVIDDAGELTDGAVAMSLDAIIRAGLDCNIRVLAAFESQALRTMFTAWAKEMRKHKNGVVLDPDHDLDGEILGVRLPRTRGGKMPEGRGYMARGGEAVLVQLAEQPTAG